MSKIIGVNTRYFSAQVQSPDGQIPTCVVLVEGEIGDYACYIGHGEQSWVARFGDKLRFEEALIYFPNIERGRYRV